MKCNYCLLAMTLSGVHYVWRWENDARAEFPPRLPPALWEPFVGRKMAHQNTDEISEPGGSCFALYADESTLISMAPGAGLSPFDTNTYKRGEHIYKPHPAPTVLAIHPMNNDIIAVGMDDSTIFIFENFVLNEILEGGHTERVSGLAFSNLLDVLVSSGKDSQLCVWGSKDWMKKDSRCLHVPHDDTSLHFYVDQLQFLVVHPRQLAVYAAKNLKELHKRDTMEFAVAPMTDATFSADGNFIYACFKDGSVCIYTSAYLVLHCNIASSAYQIDNISSSSSSTRVYPAVIAVHPEKAQLALGMTDGSIYVNI
ncbi:hypothetical protein MIMGU_mgv1a010465mg [Erythranthe guttata]|uniref:Uncharacterized protein n=2 Tax=Erythranthe guttata TaxID=4155 RepID=A0A022QDQ9_ERYGU|nr:hypothetical protein MIMGU_mgv1a010465mg [Erythranthe guttata]